MNMAKQNKRPPPERLIAAAIEQIEAHGLGQLTVRGVAAAAGANVAAVNYYFRSKEALVAAALEASIDHMVEDCEAYLDAMAEQPHQALVDLLGYLLEGALRFPRISKAHLHDAFLLDDYSGVFPRMMTPVMQRLRGALQAAVPGLSSEQAAQRVIAALSAVFFPAFFAGFYTPLEALSAPARANYVRELARQACAPPPHVDAQE